MRDINTALNTMSSRALWAMMALASHVARTSETRALRCSMDADSARHQASDWSSVHVSTPFEGQAAAAGRAWDAADTAAMESRTLSRFHERRAHVARSLYTRMSDTLRIRRIDALATQ